MDKQRVIKSVIRIFSVIAALVCCLSIFTACNFLFGDSESGKKSISITIHPQNGEDNILWKPGNKVPTITKEGYTFAGWYFDEEWLESVSFDF